MKANAVRRKKIATETQADHTSEVVRVRKVVGQLEGIEKMISSGRDCPQILQQVKAVSSALNGLAKELLRRHLGECLNEAERSKNFSKLTNQVLEIVQIQMRG